MRRPGVKFQDRHRSRRVYLGFFGQVSVNFAVALLPIWLGIYGILPDLRAELPYFTGKSETVGGRAMTGRLSPANPSLG